MKTKIGNTSPNRCACPRSLDDAESVEGRSVKNGFCQHDNLSSPVPRIRPRGCPTNPCTWPLVITVGLLGLLATCDGLYGAHEQRGPKVQQYDFILNPENTIMSAMSNEVIQGIDKLSPKAKIIVFRQLLCVLFLAEDHKFFSHMGSDSSVDNPHEYRLGVMLGWRQRLLESETNLLCGLFGGDSKIILEKNGRLFPTIDIKLRKIFSTPDPRYDSAYKDCPRSDSFVDGVICGGLLANTLVVRAEREAHAALVVKDNKIFIKDPRDAQHLIHAENVSQELSDEEKNLRFQEAPSLEALLFIKSTLCSCSDSLSDAESAGFEDKNGKD